MSATRAIRNHFDFVILGSGSAALAAALRAQELGKTVVMTEEQTTGRTCVNRGCLPSKNLIEVAKLIYDARHPRYLGLTPAHIGLNLHELITQKDDLVSPHEHSHIFVAGDVIDNEAGSEMATPVGSQDGGIVAHNAFSDGEPRQVDHRVIPRTIFIDPQVAAVGLIELVQPDMTVSLTHPHVARASRRCDPSISAHAQDGPDAKSEGCSVCPWLVLVQEK